MKYTLHICRFVWCLKNYMTSDEWVAMIEAKEHKKYRDAKELYLWLVGGGVRLCIHGTADNNVPAVSPQIIW
jgi:hypothetical protein